MTYRDDWGCLWQKVQRGILGHVIGHPLADWGAFGNCKTPDPLQQFNWAAVRQKTEDDRKRAS